MRNVEHGSMSCTGRRVSKRKVALVRYIVSVRRSGLRHEIKEELFNKWGRKLGVNQQKMLREGNY